jgi:hypothetical protein
MDRLLRRHRSATRSEGPAVGVDRRPHPRCAHLADVRHGGVVPGLCLCAREGPIGLGREGVASSFLLVHVRDAVEVAVLGLGLADPSVAAVAGPKENPGEH